MTGLEVGLTAVGSLGWALAVFWRWHLIGQRRLNLAIIGRAVKALHTRGVQKARAVELIAPELQARLLRRARQSKR